MDYCITIKTKTNEPKKWENEGVKKSTQFARIRRGVHFHA